jgi:hypothetical protein
MNPSKNPLGYNLRYQKPIAAFINLKKPFPRITHRTLDLAAVLTLAPLCERTLVPNGNECFRTLFQQNKMHENN